MNNLINGSSDTASTPQRVTPWEVIGASYLEAEVRSLHHSPVCVGARVGMEFKKLGKKTKFRLVCECGANVVLPSETIWPKAWDMFKSKEIQAGVTQGPVMPNLLD